MFDIRSPLLRFKTQAVMTAALVLLIAAPLVAQQPRTDRQSRPYLGISLMPSDRGVAIGNVTPDSPAAKAGLNAGDRILKIDNQDARDPNGLLQTIAAKKPGDKVTLRVIAKDQEKDVQVTDK